MHDEEFWNLVNEEKETADIAYIIPLEKKKRKQHQLAYLKEAESFGICG